MAQIAGNQEVPVNTARQKLELSQLSPGALQREAMGTDLDVKKFTLYLASQIQEDIAVKLTGGTISRTIEGASQLVVTVNDYDRNLLTSGLLSNKLDVQLDGLWFRLSGVDKAGDELTLTFEDREVALLRQHIGWKVMSRNRVTRAEFVLNLIREVKDFVIPVQIPELRIIQPVERYPGDPTGRAAILNKEKGIPADTNIQVKNSSENSILGKLLTPSQIDKIFAGKTLTVGTPGSDEIPATQDQIKNANIILNVGHYMGVKRKILVVSIMVALVESNLNNYAGGDGTSVGLFQMTDTGYAGNLSRDERHDQTTAAKAFFDHALKVDADFNDDISYGDLAWNIQQPAEQYRGRYALHRTQAEKYVTAFGTPGGDNEGSATDANGQITNTGTGGGGNYYFYRGNITSRGNQKIRKPENSWDCIQRLATDVDWVAFFVSGVFWFISEDDLFKQMPLMYLFEGQDGIIDIDGSYYEKAKSATMTVTAHAGRWIVPPGSLVVVQGMGPWDGRWLVNQYDRDLFTTQCTITLSKPRPALPEPNTANNTDIKSGWLPKPSTGGGQTPALEPVTPSTANPQQLAQELLTHYNVDWFDLGPGPSEQQQVWQAAHGLKINGPIGPVDIYYKVFAVLLWLIKDKGFDIGTFALCSDHGNDGSGGHAGGFAVDIAAINGVAINQNTQQAHDLTLKVAQLLHNIEGPMRPRQLICAGYGYQRSQDLLALCLPNSSTFNYVDSSGKNVLDEHTNHIHVGY